MARSKTVERIVYLSIIIVLAAGAAYLFYDNYTTKKNQALTESNMEHMDSLNQVLDVKYGGIVEELTKQKGVSAVQDAYIDSVLVDLNERKEDITQLLQTKNFLDLEKGEAE